MPRALVPLLAKGSLIVVMNDGNGFVFISHTGDPLEADAFCTHIPAPYQRMIDRGEADDLETYFENRIPGWREEIGAPVSERERTPVEDDARGLPLFAG